MKTRMTRNMKMKTTQTRNMKTWMTRPQWLWRSWKSRQRMKKLRTFVFVSPRHCADEHSFLHVATAVASAVVSVAAAVSLIAL